MTMPCIVLKVEEYSVYKAVRSLCGSAIFIGIFSNTKDHSQDEVQLQYLKCWFLMGLFFVFLLPPASDVIWRTMLVLSNYTNTSGCEVG